MRDLGEVITALSYSMNGFLKRPQCLPQSHRLKRCSLSWMFWMTTQVDAVTRFQLTKDRCDLIMPIIPPFLKDCCHERTVRCVTDQRFRCGYTCSRPGAGKKQRSSASCATGSNSRAEIVDLQAARLNFSKKSLFFPTSCNNFLGSKSLKSMHYDFLSLCWRLTFVWVFASLPLLSSASLFIFFRKVCVCL